MSNEHINFRNRNVKQNRFQSAVSFRFSNIYKDLSNKPLKDDCLTIRESEPSPIRQTSKLDTAKNKSNMELPTFVKRFLKLGPSEKSQEENTLKREMSTSDLRSVNELTDSIECNEIPIDVIDLSVALQVKDFSQVFMDFLVSEHSEENLEFYAEVQKFKQLSLPQEIYVKSKEIYDKYISDKADKLINIDSNAKDTITHLLKYPNSSMFDACEDQIYNLMKNDCLPRFLITKTFKYSMKKLPSLSPKNKILLNPYSEYKSHSLSVSSNENPLKKFNSASNLSSNSLFDRRGSSENVRKYILMPKYPTIDYKNVEVTNQNIKIIIDGKSLILPSKDGLTIGEMISFLNIPSRELSNYYAFLLPGQQIIDFTQNSFYYVRKTFEILKFSVVKLIINDETYSVKCECSTPIMNAINNILSSLKISCPNPSISLKNKKSIKPDDICSKYDKSSIVVGL